MHRKFLLTIVFGALAMLFILPVIVGMILRRLAPLNCGPAPEGVSSESWQEILAGNPAAAKCLGGLEGLLAYGSFLAFDKNAALVVGGWLAFKVASKWESWQNIIQVPQTLQGVSDVDFLRARRQWGTTIYLRFLIGTLINLLFGFLAAAIVNLFR